MAEGFAINMTKTAREWVQRGSKHPLHVKIDDVGTKSASSDMSYLKNQWPIVAGHVQPILGECAVQWACCFWQHGFPSA